MSTRGAGAGDEVTTRLTGWIEPVVAAAGYDLEELVVRPAGQRSVVRVVVDRDSGVSLDDVAQVSRALSEVLDAEDEALGRSPYVLEVTSPGVDRLLTLPRHWRRNVGRLVTVAVGPEKAREQVTSRVLRVEDDGVVLTVEKGGTKKGQPRRTVGERTVPWAELGEARVQVEFTRPAGHRDAALVYEADEHEADEHEADEHEDDEHEDDTDTDDELDDDDLSDDELDDEQDGPEGTDDQHDPTGAPAAGAAGGPGDRDPAARRGAPGRDQEAEK
ncbi:ribosome maturation factor RimP [Modestobacter sp. SSW1-42]|uniref:ribosome maturation factor RimP n=1 Tax=Modestobacter sp. SSW1-42 TaxID=596372 RepID=UPI003987ECD4